MLKQGVQTLSTSYPFGTASFLSSKPKPARISAKAPLPTPGKDNDELDPGPDPEPELDAARLGIKACPSERQFEQYS